MTEQVTSGCTSWFAPALSSVRWHPDDEKLSYFLRLHVRWPLRCPYKHLEAVHLSPVHLVTATGVAGSRSICVCSHFAALQRRSLEKESRTQRGERVHNDA
jgi:hypothetical protein